MEMIFPFHPGLHPIYFLLAHYNKEYTLKETEDGYEVIFDSSSYQVSKECWEQFQQLKKYIPNEKEKEEVDFLCELVETISKEHYRSGYCDAENDASWFLTVRNREFASLSEVAVEVDNRPNTQKFPMLPWPGSSVSNDSSEDTVNLKRRNFSEKTQQLLSELDEFQNL